MGPDPAGRQNASRCRDPIWQRDEEHGSDARRRTIRGAEEHPQAWEKLVRRPGQNRRLAEQERGRKESRLGGGTENAAAISGVGQGGRGGAQLYGGYVRTADPEGDQGRRSSSRDRKRHRRNRDG